MSDWSNNEARKDVKIKCLIKEWRKDVNDGKIKLVLIKWNNKRCKWCQNK